MDNGKKNTQSIQLKVNFEVKKSPWRIKKIDHETNEGLPCAEFKAIISSTNEEIELKTNDEGIYEGAPQLIGETITLVETTAPHGYTLLSDPFVLIITSTGNYFEISNERMDPKVGTIATGRNGEKVFDPQQNNTVIDEITYEWMIPGITYIRTTELVQKGISSEQDKTIQEQEAEVTFTEANGTEKVEMTIPKGTIKEDGEYYFRERYVKAETPATTFVEHNDRNDKGQTIRFETPVKTSETRTSNPTKSSMASYLPSTGERLVANMLVGLGMILIVVSLLVYGYLHYAHKGRYKEESHF